MIYIVKLWKFLQGYVIISIKGFNIHKFVNRAINNGIRLYDIQIGKSYNCYIHFSQIPNLQQLAKSNNCNITICSVSIASYIIQNFKYKFVYVLGIVVFNIMLLVFSSLIWLIDIDGNNIITKNDIIDICNNEGLCVGSTISKLDSRQLSKTIKNKYNNIAWINVSITGTRIHIKLTEEISKTNNIPATQPCNIIAKDNSIISEIVTEKGTPLVKKNDVVSKGDILISGKLSNSGTEEIEINDLVHSSGHIKGYVTKNIKISAPLKIHQKKYTDKTFSKYCIKLWNFYIGDNYKSISNYDCIKEIKQFKIKENIPLPIILYKYEYKEFVLEEKILSINNAKNIIRKELLGYIVNNYPTNSDIMSCNVEYKKQNNKLISKITIVSNDNIGLEQKLQ